MYAMHVRSNQRVHVVDLMEPKIRVGCHFKIVSHRRRSGLEKIYKLSIADLLFFFTTSSLERFLFLSSSQHQLFLFSHDARSII
jgi:hypothetical protein